MAMGNNQNKIDEEQESMYAGEKKKSKSLMDGDTGMVSNNGQKNIDSYNKKNQSNPEIKDSATEKPKKMKSDKENNMEKVMRGTVKSDYKNGKIAYSSWVGGAGKQGGDNEDTYTEERVERQTAINADRKKRKAKRIKMAKETRGNEDMYAGEKK